MPRTIRCFLFLALLLRITSFAFAVTPAAIPRFIYPPTLDGQLDDWPATPLMVMADASIWYSPSTEYAGPEDISAEVRLGWDNTNLYVSVKTRDDKLVRVPSVGEIDKRGDSIVLALMGEGSQVSNEFAVTLVGSGSPRIFRSEPAARAGEVKSVSCLIDPRVDEGGGWRVVYEFFLPWSELEGLRPIAGEQAKLTLAVSDDDGAGLKGFMEQSMQVELSASTKPIAGVTELVPPGRPSLPAGFLAADTVRFDKRHFLVHKQDAFLYGGEIDYLHLPRAVWAERLAQVKAAGMNIVSISVPWSAYQPAQAEPLFTELEAFLEAVKAAGLWAQVNVGPFTNERFAYGGLPAWYLLLDGAARQKAADVWMSALLRMLKPYQITNDGPVIALLARAIPETGGWTSPASLAHLMNGLSRSGLRVPFLTANAPAARDNSRQSLANLLDTLSFYEPPSATDLGELLATLAQEENGPVVVALPGDYTSPAFARASVNRVKMAMGRGATAVTISDFAPGREATAPLSLRDSSLKGVITDSPLPSAGYGELRLLGNFLRLFGAPLARAVPAEGVIRADAREVQAAIRLTEKSGFIFLWNEKGDRTRQVRLTYSEPGTTTVINIPAAGTINLPVNGAKILPVDVPVGWGTLRYSTSEIAGLHHIGDRTLLIVYGDQDTPGEIALQWPGSPLVVGEVLRQDWDASRKLLILDYYHKAQDQYVLVDDLQIAILSRERAVSLAQAGDPVTLSLSAGVEATNVTAISSGVKATLLVPTGETQVTVALPATPAAVTLDGKPASYTYTAPSRVLELNLTTDTFEQERQPANVWAKISRSVTGGPPQLYASFDRAPFRADKEAPTTWTEIGPLGRAPEAAGLVVGEFAKLRTRLDPAGHTKLVLLEATDPTLVFVNGKRVVFPDNAPTREADISSLLAAGENEISLFIHLLPRASGLASLRDPEKRLPLVVLKGEGEDIIPDKWEAAPGLAGEAAGWAGMNVPVEGWNVLRFGPWREQGRRFEDITDTGWYRVNFALPKPDGWQVPYQVHVVVSGNARLYLNGAKLATLLCSGSYTVPLPIPPLAPGGENVLAVAIYDPAGKGGLEKVEIIGDVDHMQKKRVLEITY